MFYDEELKAIKNAHRFRQRHTKTHLADFGSNDYLALAHDKPVFNKTVSYLASLGTHGAKASQLVNGYHPIFKRFERYLCRLTGFPAALTIGSGFLGNLALFEALARKGDVLLIDADYHASGILGAKLTQARVEFFAHNSAQDLRRHLQALFPHQIANASSSAPAHAAQNAQDQTARANNPSAQNQSTQTAQDPSAKKSSATRRIFIAVEGIYSMSGELLDRAIIDLAQEFGAILIVDEAHSVGVIGHRLLGVLDHYGIEPTQRIIKLGTLGKALGSYGAYILASKEIVSFLENRAKPLIYSTAPSIFDVAYAYFALQKIQKNLKRYKTFISLAQDLAQKALGVKTHSLIIPVEFPSSAALLKKVALLEKRGFFVAAIRPPTVKKPIIRLILRKDLKKLIDLLNIL